MSNHDRKCDGEPWWGGCGVDPWLGEDVEPKKKGKCCCEEDYSCQYHGDWWASLPVDTKLALEALVHSLKTEK